MTFEEEIPFVGTPTEHRAQFDAWAQAIKIREEAIHTILTAVAALDLVSDGTGDFECPFYCDGFLFVDRRSAPHEHAATCPITLARQMTQEAKPE